MMLRVATTATLALAQAGPPSAQSKGPPSGAPGGPPSGKHGNHGKPPPGHAPPADKHHQEPKHHPDPAHHEAQYRDEAVAQDCSADTPQDDMDWSYNGKTCKDVNGQQSCGMVSHGWPQDKVAELFLSCRTSCEVCDAVLCDDKDQFLQGLVGMNCQTLHAAVGGDCMSPLGALIPQFGFLLDLKEPATLGMFCATTCFGQECPECKSHSQCGNGEYCDMTGFCFADYQCCEYQDAIDKKCPMQCAADFDADEFEKKQPIRTCIDDDACKTGEFCKKEKDDNGNDNGQKKGSSNNLEGKCMSCNKCENAFMSPLGYDKECHERCRDWCNEQIMKDKEAHDGRSCFQGDEQYGRCVTCGYSKDKKLSDKKKMCITCEKGYAIDLKESGLDSDCTGYCVKEKELSNWGIGRYPCKPRAKCIADGFRIDRTLLLAIVLGIVGASVCGCLCLCCCCICCMCICCKCCCGKKKPPASKAPPQQVVMMAAPAQQVQMHSPQRPMGAPMAQLPPGWTMVRDPQTGRNYYCNAATNQTSWTHPVTGI